ncbi:YfcE family phosphodiesterase [Sulfurimonas aquatica]|uniref:Phosphoesterase n=1 Tax=Sulfurimonas aquatica TaxID=2672570 RepID=A0A975AY53_9BACT|nr:YfcE family phosphodiesterase [Sulfurimonas aquatica]QSZ40729.1 YfcE family phosphodiesterase [Sulfurimonas aquatica]
MKIGILSDTHTKVKKAKATLDILIENGAEFIIHAGDIVEPEVLELLKNCGKKYVAVYGNNDAHLVSFHNKYNLVQEPNYFKLANTKFKLMHLPYYMSPDAEVVVFGHTHKFHSEFNNGTLFLNPGESCARNKPVSECALLEVTADKFFVTYYSKKKKDDFFKAKEFSYKRKKK